MPGWTPRPRPPWTPMVGRWCRLEPLDPARHADELYAAYSLAPDGRDWTYLYSGPFASAADYRRHAQAIAGREDPMQFAVVESAGGRAVGTLALMRIEPAHGVVEVGHVAYSPALQRTPAGTEAQYLLMRRVFDELGYRRHEWKCDALNAPSRRAAERYGFSFEGVFRQAIVTQGRNRDTAWYSLLDREWPAVRGAFEAWLAPGNFDGDGRQRLRLGELVARARDAGG